jgi:hypothetical protein
MKQQQQQQQQQQQVPLLTTCHHLTGHQQHRNTSSNAAATLFCVRPQHPWIAVVAMLFVHGAFTPCAVQHVLSATCMCPVVKVFIA